MGYAKPPRLWASFRDQCLKEIVVTLGSEVVWLAQSSVDENLWLILMGPARGQGPETLNGYLLIYVDDLLLAAALEVVQALALAVKQVWPTSPLRVAADCEPIRFVGLDVFCVPGGFRVGQQGYIEEVARQHGWTGHARTPVTKDLACFELLPSDSEPTPGRVLHAQMWAGELLWIAQRSRPDVAYASALVSSLCTRAPERAIQIAQRSLSYLLDTRGWSMYYIASGNALTGYGDASFSPEGGRSHTGLAIYYRSCALSWKSCRQSLTTLSTAEAELIALQETALALVSVEAMLEASLVFPEEKVLFSDSTAAVAIQNGSSSFRTRHL